jgi:hypothetical protein
MHFVITFQRFRFSVYVKSEYNIVEQNNQIGLVDSQTNWKQPHMKTYLITF